MGDAILTGQDTAGVALQSEDVLRIIEAVSVQLDTSK